MSDPVESHGAERMTFFTDAVVAIAMTLLILPLLESVSEAAKDGFDTAQYFDEHGSQLFAFVLSFVIIASFWIGHQRLFEHVGRWTSPLMLLNVAWMLSIVFLPVITAMVGTMETDRLQIALYVGTMAVTSLLAAVMNLVVRRTPVTWSDAGRPGVGGLAAQLTLAVLFLLALAVAVLFPSVNYFALFLLFASGPLQGRVRAIAERRGVA